MSTQPVTPTPTVPPPTPVFGPQTPVYPMNTVPGLQGVQTFIAAYFTYAAEYNYNNDVANAVLNSLSPFSVPIPKLSRAVEVNGEWQVLTDVPWLPIIPPVPPSATTPASPVGNLLGGTVATYAAIPANLPELNLKNGDLYKEDPRGTFMFYSYPTPFGNEQYFVLTGK